MLFTENFAGSIVSTLLFKFKCMYNSRGISLYNNEEVFNVFNINF